MEFCLIICLPTGVLGLGMFPIFCFPFIYFCCFVSHLPEMDAKFTIFLASLSLSFLKIIYTFETTHLSLWIALVELHILLSHIFIIIQFKIFLNFYCNFHLLPMDYLEKYIY